MFAEDLAGREAMPTNVGRSSPRARCFRSRQCLRFQAEWADYKSNRLGYSYSTLWEGIFLDFNKPPVGNKGKPRPKRGAAVDCEPKLGHPLRTVAVGAAFAGVGGPASGLMPHGNCNNRLCLHFEGLSTI